MLYFFRTHCVRTARRLAARPSRAALDGNEGFYFSVLRNKKVKKCPSEGEDTSKNASHLAMKNFCCRKISPVAKTKKSVPQDRKAVEENNAMLRISYV